MQPKHRIIFEYDGIRVEAYKTQLEISEILKDSGVKLVSVNDRGCYSRSKRKKR
jgi:hypothetical protein